MCRQNCGVKSSAEEVVSAEERLLIYCKPVQLYNILHCRSLYSPSFLPRCLNYKIQARDKRKFRSGIVVFNYKDSRNIIQKTEVTEDFSCPFCFMLCGSFKGLRLHLSSSHDLFDFFFWSSDGYQAVNVSVKLDALRFEEITSEEERFQTFSFCSKPRKRSRKDDHDVEPLSMQFLELESHNLASDTNNGIPHLDDENRPSGYPNTIQLGGLFGMTSNIASTPAAVAHSSVDSDAKSILTSEAVVPATRTRKLATERSEARSYMLLQKRQFYHSHRVQPMALAQVLSDRDSEDEVDDDIADLEDRRMLDDFVDVSKDEKRFMHLWNSFVRKQRVIADGHVPWACEAFSKLHGKELLRCPPLFWSWRLFMVKLWNHGLLYASTINNCNLILESFRNQEGDATNNAGGYNPNSDDNFSQEHGL
ncbi:PREDICTED: polycomb group protein VERNALIZATION 2 [Tarenaya hassleriana]|uniref:polycomb group protein VERNALIZATION 2 n=1 Tax=Tarenaya hassleriana TaxID=28532 RepID=UPI00053C2F6B|nr:PREDICTED: polycomb group protein VERNALIZATION 2 [Tarenaya hassleriana]